MCAYLYIYTCVYMYMSAYVDVSVLITGKPVARFGCFGLLLICFEGTQFAGHALQGHPPVSNSLQPWAQIPSLKTGQRFQSSSSL